MGAAAPSDIRTRGFVGELLGRREYAIISEIVAPNSRVLDLGCGEGELLAWLADNRNVEGRGIEISPSRVQRAIARGVSVYQGDIDAGLPIYPNDAFDYVILSQTLQETRNPLAVLREMLRVGQRAIVVFPNYGHWRVRLSLLFTGRAPRTQAFPHSWYDSPNIHFFTADDFEELARQESIVIERRIFLAGHRRIRLWHNLLADVAVYLIRAQSR
jgi:methionine biosynthesis protein MetW